MWTRRETNPDDTSESELAAKFNTRAYTPVKSQSRLHYKSTHKRPSVYNGMHRRRNKRYTR